MLSQDENTKLTRVGPGTPMGDLLRRYWMPALLSEEIPEPDSPPVRVKLLGEELVAFRDTSGRIGLIDEFCPHRLVSLFLGRNEENGLRCVYHGWKMDVNGRCVDMPNEPEDLRFAEKIKVAAYPTAELGGVVWAFLGPPEKQPELPGMEWLRAPGTHRYVSRTWEQCNYLQAIEGGIDTVHSSFLHNNNLSDKNDYRSNATAARLEVERTDYGLRYAGIRDVGEDGNFVRIYQFVLPFHQMRASLLEGRKGAMPASMPQLRGHMWVPMDDENTMNFNWVYSLDADKPFTEEYIQHYETQAGRGLTGEGTTRTRTRDNNWLIDRELQRTMNFTGIMGLNTQDLAVQESMGRIVDRSREHLGSTDRAVILLRRLLIEAIGDVEEGVDPAGVDPRSYAHVRAAEVVMPKDAAWRDQAEQLTVAAR